MPTLIALANATRPRRPPGARTPTTVDPFGSYTAAVTLLDPLGLSQPLRADELEDIKVLAGNARAIAEAFVDNRRPPSLGILNRFAEQAKATQMVHIRPDGALTAEVRWHTTSATSELACRIVTELGRLDPDRLRPCAREACDLLFYDTTRSRTQRWHSESPCGFRERQDRWRKAARTDRAITA